MISINISELIWTVINFFLLLFLLKHFLYTPVLRFMDERQARIDARLDEERRAGERVQENDERLSAEKAESRKEAKRILNSAGSAAEQRRGEALARAREAAGESRRSAEASLAARCEEEKTHLAAAMPELAELMVKRLLGEES